MPLMVTTILPHDLPQALDDAPAGCSILSLDCFDTLLWRNTHAPMHVFADIGEHGGTVQQRRWAESHARSHAALHRNRNETPIGDIYRMLLPNASDDVRERAIAAELAAEARHCFAFRPTVELMREAKRRGWKVVVVSDTYLNREQLGALIAAAAGDEVRALIDAIFCSSEHDVSKTEGLFKPVLKALRVKPEAILHIGDNLAADAHAPAQHGIAARHLVQFTGDTEQRLRLEAAVGAMLDGGNAQAAACQPHRAQLAAGEPGIADPATRLGYSVLGPVLRTFDLWLRDEAAALAAASGSRVHLLFLMRDGFLPLKICEAAGVPDGVSAPVEISRFTAQAASFTDRASIDRFMERELGQEDYKSVARQMLFTAPESLALKGHGAVNHATFSANVHRPKNLASVIERSAAFGERLIQHVRNAVDPQPGDTLMLVDLGYNGTVQSRIEPLLRDKLGVAVAGRYLLLREQQIDGFDKRGLFDARHYDMAALEAMTTNAAVLEQLCTVAQGSVVDYTADGQPIRSEPGVKGRQSEVREAVQAGAIAFARDNHMAVNRAPVSDNADTRRRAAAAVLSRFMFLPLAGELAVLHRFEHDVNLGGGETVPLFDTDAATAELRRSGMFYLKEAERMYLPAELHGHGLPLSLSLLAQRRFGLELRAADFRGSSIDLPIIVADGRTVSVDQIAATKTHDGFLSATIPIGHAQYAIGLQFGRLYEWVEVESADFHRAPSAADELGPRRAVTRIPAKLSFEGLERVGGGLMRCIDDTAFMMIPPPAPTGEAMVLTVVFRPIVWRTPATAAQPADNRVAAEVVT
jgi:FMN phosphatase YigB (HAD superfamily)